MKTVKFLAAAFVLSVVVASCQKESIEPPSIAPDAARLKTGLPYPKPNVEPKTLAGEVIYQVNVNLAIDKTICNIYWVELVDANGKFVAPQQTFIPGKSFYTFRESIRQRSGIRVARLVLSPAADHFACPTELSFQPDRQTIQFQDGETYLFNLYPMVSAPKSNRLIISE
jgi:hypothetical protein